MVLPWKNLVFLKWFRLDCINMHMLFFSNKYAGTIYVVSLILPLFAIGCAHQELTQVSVPEENTKTEQIIEPPPPRPPVLFVPASEKKDKDKKNIVRQKPKEKKTSNNFVNILPPLLQEVEGKYHISGTVRADFIQTQYLAALDVEKESSGSIVAKRPDKIYWETLSPEKSLFVTNGKKIWFYSPPFDESEAGHVIIRKGPLSSSNLAQALLSGSFSMARDMNIVKKTEGSFLMTPKKGQAGTIKYVEIKIDLDSKHIYEVILFHQNGNKATIGLSRIELGSKIEDNMFLFNPPRGTRVESK